MEIFKIGDAVNLKSGGPRMTIQKDSEVAGQVVCQWFDENALRTGDFPEESLVKNDGIPAE